MKGSAVVRWVSLIDPCFLQASRRCRMKKRGKPSKPARKPTKRMRQPKVINKLMTDDKGVTEAIAKGVRAALRRHKLLGESIVVWKNGKVVWIKAEDIEA